MSPSLASPPSSTSSKDTIGTAGAANDVSNSKAELKLEHVELDLVDKLKPETKPEPDEQLPNTNREGSVSGATVVYSQGLLKSHYDAMGVLECLWLFRRSLLYTSIAFIGRMMQYFEVVMSTAVATSPGFAAEFGVDGVLSPKWVSAWTYGISIGQMLPMLLITMAADKYGRKPSLLFAWVLTTAALVCFSTARSPGVWLLGRVLTGGSTGVLNVVAAPYGSEICTSRIRGIVLTSAIFLGAVATLLATVMMRCLLEEGPDGGPILAPGDWRIAVYAMWGPVGAMLLCYIVLPESPWFYAHEGKYDKVVHVLNRLYSGVPCYDFEEQYGIMRRTLERENELVPIHEEWPWADLFKGNNKKRTLVSAMLTASVHMGGFPLLSTFGLSAFAQAGFTNPFDITMVVAAVGCATVVAMMMLFDYYGRRTFVNVGYILQGVSMLVWGCLGSAPSSGSGRLGGLAFVTCWWALTSALSNAQTIYLSEVPAEYLHIKTSSLCVCVSGVLDIASNFAIPEMLAKMGLRSGFVFFGLSVPFAVFLWLYLPETMGRHPSEIDELYDRDVPAWQWANTRTYIEEEFAEAMRAQRYEGSMYDGATQRGDNDSDPEQKSIRAPSTRAPSTRAASTRAPSHAPSNRGVPRKPKSVAEQA